MNKILIDRPLHKDALKLLSDNAEVIGIYDDIRPGRLFEESHNIRRFYPPLTAF